jgi:hypothetical protein
MLFKIKNFFKTIFKSIEEAQKLRAESYIRFHNKGMFRGFWD